MRTHFLSHSSDLKLKFFHCSLTLCLNFPQTMTLNSLWYLNTTTRIIVILHIVDKIIETNTLSVLMTIIHKLRALVGGSTQRSWNTGQNMAATGVWLTTKNILFVSHTSACFLMSAGGDECDWCTTLSPPPGYVSRPQAPIVQPPHTKTPRRPGFPKQKF